MDPVDRVPNSHEEISSPDALRDVLRIARLSANAPFAQLGMAGNILAWSGDDEIARSLKDDAPLRELLAIAELHPSGTSVSLAGSTTTPWAASMQAVALTGPNAEAAWLVMVYDQEPSTNSVEHQKTADILEAAGSLAERLLDRALEDERIRDLSEKLRQSQAVLSRTSEQLEISNHELEQFAYVASHELVSPLRAVSVYAQLLNQVLSNVSLDAETDQKLESCVGEITRGIGLMSTQVQSLLELSSVNSTATVSEPVDIAEAVGNALATLAPQLEELNATVNIGDLPIVTGQLVPLQGVFANLFANSMRYREPGRPLEITVEASTSATHGRITVRDNGIGVTEADADRIFQLFERASTSTDGTGIGLALSRRIVESFGGTIGVESNVATGSVFWIELPSAALPLQQAS